MQLPESSDSKNGLHGDALTWPAALVPSVLFSSRQEAGLLIDQKVVKPPRRLAAGGLVAFNPNFTELPSTS